jgi:hypothetical protein
MDLQLLSCGTRGRLLASATIDYTRSRLMREAPQAGAGMDSVASY